MFKEILIIVLTIIAMYCSYRAGYQNGINDWRKSELYLDDEKK